MNKLIKLAFKLSDTRAEKLASFELLGNANCLDISETSVAGSKRTFNVDSSSGPKSAKNMDEALYTEYMILLREQLAIVQNAIINKIPPPNNIQDDETLLLCARMTILRDNWFALKNQTKERGPFVRHVHTLFLLQMYLRYWRRHEQFIPMKEPGPTELKPPVWCNSYDFTGGAWFGVLLNENGVDDPKGNKQPVVHWSPDKVFRAMNSLMRTRVLGAVDLSTPNACRLFSEYRNALADKIALSLVFPVSGSPEKLAPTRPSWFKLTSSIILEENAMSANEGGYLALCRQIRKRQEEDTQRIIEREHLDIEFDKTAALESREQTIHRLKDLKNKNELKSLQYELDALYITKSALETEDFGDGNADERELGREWMDELPIDEVVGDMEEDAKELRSVNKKIEDLETLLRSKEKSGIEKRKNDANAEIDLISSILFESGEDGPESDIDVYVSNASFDYARDNMLLHDHLFQWQFPEESETGKYTEVINSSCGTIHTELISVMTRCNSDAAVSDSHRWVVCSRITMCERELYRSIYSADAVFTVLDVCAAQRGEEDTVISDYPQTVEDLLTETSGAYYNIFIAYAVRFWMIQILSKINVDASIFFWDAEEEYLCLNRRVLLHPAITRIGNRWCLLRKGSWENNDKSGINCEWFDENILECVVKWMDLMEENNWTVVDRCTGQIIDLERTPIRDAYMKTALYTARASSLEETGD